MRASYFICALVTLLAASARSGSADVAAQAGPNAAQPVTAAADTRGFMVFLRGTPVGREDVTVSTDANGTVISSRNRLSPPFDLITRRAEIRYRPEWIPEELTIEATAQLREVAVRTTFANGEAATEGVEAGKPFAKTDKVSLQTIVLPNLFFGAYEALTRRLAGVAPGARVTVYIAPQAEVPVTIKSVTTDRVQTGSTTFTVRRYELGFPIPGGELTAQLSADEQGHLIRLTVPAQSLDVVREDLAASTSRTQVYSNPGDEAVTIPASGFNIAGTLTRPKTQAARVPAVVVLSGSGVGDRDGIAAGVPTLGQLAGALADAGFLVVRYDKRGYGQTGGRAESATLGDLAEDARDVVRYMSRRKDVDPKRIALVGHSEGAWVALQAAARDDHIAAVVTIAASASTGADLILEQQRHLLEQLKTPDAERQAKIELQQKIHSAVLTGKGWEGIPPELKKQADTAWFQSLLAYDPAKVLERVKQPLLILHGELDRQVPVAHAERLADLARKKRHSKGVEVVTVRGLNHLLVPATTGEVSEYGSLPDRNVSKDVTTAIANWLTKTFAAIR
jgi:hypothetical protein